MKSGNFVILFTPVRPLSNADRERLTLETVSWAKEQQRLGRGLLPHMLSQERVPLGEPLPAALAGNPPLMALLFLSARDLEEAAEVARSHPALQHGYHAEVRPWTSPQPPSASPRG